MKTHLIHGESKGTQPILCVLETFPFLNALKIQLLKRKKTKTKSFLAQPLLRAYI